MKKLILLLTFMLSSIISYSAKYYINDNSTTGDVYCTAIGASLNNGTSKSTPKQTLTQINTAYTLATGDSIFIDAGTYTGDKGFIWSVGIVIQGAGATKTSLDISSVANASKTYFAYFNNGGVTSNLTVSINKIEFVGYSSVNSSYGSVITFNGNSSHVCTLNLNNVEMTGCGGSSGQTSMPCVNITGYANFNMTGGGFLCNGSSTSHYNGSAIQVSGTNNTVASVLTSVTFLNNYTCYASNSSTSQPCSLINLLANSPVTQGGNNTFSMSNCLFNNNTMDQNYAGAYGGSCLYIAHGSVTITSCSFNTDLVTTYSANVAYGSVISITGGSVNITKSEFTSNSSISGSGSMAGTISAYSTNNTITLNIGTSGVSTDGCSFSSNGNNNGNDLYVKQSGANTNTVKGYYTTFGSSSSSGSIYAVNYNNANGGSVTIANCGNPTNNATITKTNTTAAPSFTSPTIPTYTGICGTFVLPIELLYFKVEPHKEYNHLTWSTASEYNNDYFTLEKTQDGTYYYNIAVIHGAGESRTQLYYEYYDNDILGGITYYVLRQTDYDGKYKRSDIISIDNRKMVGPTLVKVVNLLGQEVTSEYKGVLIFIYSDGTTIKRFF